MINRRTYEVSAFHAASTIAVVVSVGLSVRSGLQPTGRSMVDPVWLTVFAVGFTLAVVHAPRIFLVLFGAVALVAESQSGAALAVASAIVGLIGADRHGLMSRLPRNDSALPTMVGALAGPFALSTLFDISDVAGTGSSAVLAGVISTVLLVVSLPRPLPRLVAPTLLGLLVASVPIVAIAVDGARAVQESVYAAQAHGDSAASALRSGDLELAAHELNELESSTGAAVDSLGSWKLIPVKLAPVASQNLTTIERVAVSGFEVAGTASDVLGVARSDEDLFAHGAIAVDQVRAIVDSGNALRVDAEVLGETLVADRSPWIAPPLDDALDVAHDRLAPLVDQAEGAAALSGLTNALLGADGPRQYLVLFANPAEARELGGHTGSTAVLRVVDGQITLIDTRRNGILNQNSTSVAVLTTELPARYLEQRPWEFSQNYTGTSDLPTISAALADIYPAVTEHEINGVIYIDPLALDALIGLSGPVTLDSVGRTFQRGDLATFLLRNQYAEYDPKGEREAVFAELGTAAFEALSNGNIDATVDDLERLTTVIRQGRLAFAPVDALEQEAMDALGVSGSMTELRSNADYVSVSHVNASPNKLDAYLHRTVQYDVSIVGDALTATATITLENQAPAGLPEFAAGNTNGLPSGTNRMTLVVHTPHEIVSWGGADHEPELTRSFREYGRWRHERVVIIPRGETRTVTIELAGQTPSGTYALDIDAQPLVHADRVEVTVDRGEKTSRSAFVLRHDTTITPS